MSKLIDLVVNELRDIAERADKQRLSVWFETFHNEFPALHAQLIKARDMPDAETALAYLISQDLRWAGLKLINNHMKYIRFVHGWMNEQNQVVPRALPPMSSTRRRKRNERKQ